jgi:hypothetical protein
VFICVINGAVTLSRRVQVGKWQALAGVQAQAGGRWAAAVGHCGAGGVVHILQAVAAVLAGSGTTSGL